VQHQHISKRYNIQFGIYAFFCVLFMVLSIQFPILNHKFQSFVVEITTPVLEAIQQPSKWINAVGNSITGHIAVYEENKILQEEVLNNQYLIRDLAIAQNENRELRKLLNIVEETKGKSLTGRIISDKKSTFSHTVIVQIGTEQGVEKGQVVINKNGLVGRVLEVFDNSARLLLITDYTSRIPVKVIGADVRGIVRGTNSYNLELIFTEDEDIKIKEGMLIVTTGVDGLFPQGLPVGVIHSVGKSIYIKPYADFSNLEFVSIQRQKVQGVL
jgi:rod shape-determining protein MreC